VKLAELLAQPALRLMELTARAVAASDADGRIVYVNREFCREFRARPENVVGVIAPEHLPPAARSLWLEHSSAWRRGELRPLYAVLPDGSGVSRPYFVVPVPVFDARRHHYIGIVASFVRSDPDGDADAIGRVAGDESTLRIVLADIANSLSVVSTAAHSAGAELEALRRCLPQLGALTEREWAVAFRIASGDRTSSIATELGIRVVTVRNHLRAVFRKVGVRNQLELIDQLARWRAGQNGAS
jgi:DNA-binding CsgD family transcriptional regulator